MLKILKFIAFALLSSFFIFGIVGFFLPNAQHVERQIVLDAPASDVFPYLNDFHQFNKWSPWAKLDPNARYTYSGAQQGIGAKIEWQSEYQSVGSGSQEIVDARQNDYLKTRLDLGAGEPATATFRLIESAGKTTLTWAFDAQLNNIVSRYFGLMLDQWVGAAYETGLSDLKMLVEADS